LAAAPAPLAALLFLSAAQLDAAKAIIRPAAAKRAAVLFAKLCMLVSPFTKKEGARMRAGVLVPSITTVLSAKPRAIPTVNS
jgi:hypothetical protein